MGHKGKHDECEGYSKEVINMLNFASMMGLTWGGDDKSLLDLFFCYR
jgi:hypothetical protein